MRSEDKHHQPRPERANRDDQAPGQDRVLPNPRRNAGRVDGATHLRRPSPAPADAAAAAAADLQAGEGRQRQIAVKRIANEVGLPDLTQKTMRTFMATMVRKLCPQIPREKRSIWLGHVVRQGSTTTDHYEISDAEYLTEVALATDYVLQQIRLRCSDKGFAIEVRLNAAELRILGIHSAAQRN